MNTQAKLDYDIIIAGAGVVGNSLACALSQQGLRVAQIDPAPAPIQQLDPATDLRVFAITRVSEFLFQHLGVWQHFPNERLGRFDKMQVWADQGEINFDVAELGEPALGHIIEQQVLQLGLQQQRNDNWQTFSGKRLVRFYSEPERMRVKLDDGQYLDASLLVAADGRGSFVREQAGISLANRDYKQQALVTTLETEKAHDYCARQRFLSQGPLAFLPLNDPHQISIVWTLPSDEALRQQALSVEDFEASVSSAFEMRLGKVRCLDKRLCFPLNRQQAEDYVQNRLVLIGDAAHGIHPLAGQGVNLGLLDVACLAEVLAEGQRQQRDLGALALLRRYERWRKGDNLAMAYMMDGFNDLFSNNNSLLKNLRNLGLSLSDQIPVLKRQMMHYAMGDRGDLPPLMQRPES